MRVEEAASGRESARAKETESEVGKTPKKLVSGWVEWVVEGSHVMRGGMRESCREDEAGEEEDEAEDVEIVDETQFHSARAAMEKERKIGVVEGEAGEDVAREARGSNNRVSMSHLREQAWQITRRVSERRRTNVRRRRRCIPPTMT